MDKGLRYQFSRAVWGFTEILIIALMAVGWVLLRPVTVTGHSMEPAYPPGTRLMMSDAYGILGPVVKGDVIVFRDPQGSEKLLVKRVFAESGQNVPSLLTPYAGTGLEQHVAYRVPSGAYYVLGDNLGDSIDSRSYGHIRPPVIVGKVVELPGRLRGQTFWVVLGCTGLLVAALAGAMHMKNA